MSQRSRRSGWRRRALAARLATAPAITVTLLSATACDGENPASTRQHSESGRWAQGTAPSPIQGPGLVQMAGFNAPQSRHNHAMPMTDKLTSQLNQHRYEHSTASNASTRCHQQRPSHDCQRRPLRDRQGEQWLVSSGPLCKDSALNECKTDSNRIISMFLLNQPPRPRPAPPPFRTCKRRR